jgi:hypothetical protein
MAENKNAVTISRGAGTEPIVIELQDGDTVATVLTRAEVTVGNDETATLNDQKVKRRTKAKVKNGDIIVIAGKPSNG